MFQDAIPTLMTGVYLTGHGGLEALEYREDIPVPTLGPSDVLIKVMAAGVNNTDINTRIGWYSKSIDGDTQSGGTQGYDSVDSQDASWAGEALLFPRIQGADVCGYIVSVGSDIDAKRIGERVVVRTLLQRENSGPYDCITFGSEMDGGFAQYALAPSRDTYKVDCDWSDIELASIPCAYSTAENALHRIGLGAETILITGASGGVGSAAIQLAKRRGATVIAMTSKGKAEALKQLGADRIVLRDSDLVAELGDSQIDVIYDLVAGPQWPSLLDILKRGGRYATSGAIAGPITEIDIRTLYLKDLTLIGTTYQAREVFENLVRYIENGEIKPLIAKTYPLNDIRQAQAEFLAKNHIGKIVLIPPHTD